MDAEVRSAVALSHLGDLPTDVVDQLTANAVKVQLAAGSVSSREGEVARHLDLVVTGVVRMFVVAPDGRTMTVRYGRPGALIGVVSLFAASYATPVTTQALVDSELLRISASVASRAASLDVRVAHAFLGELSERVLSFIYEIPGSAFATVRQRVARHLLDLASESAPDRASDRPMRNELVVLQNQQELADAVGTAREVVVRALRELRQEGVVRTGRNRIVIVDPDRLALQHGWNQSP